MESEEEADALAPKFIVDGQFIEGWMRGTYVVAGIFAISSPQVTVAEIRRNIPTLYRITKKAKRGWWPRGISGMFLFSFYLGTHFEPEVIAWVQNRQPYRYAIWHEPLLYDTGQNSVWMRSNYGLFGSAFHPLVFTLYVRALKLIAERLQRSGPAFINGAPVK